MELRKNAKQKLLKQVPLFARCSGPELEAIGKIADEIDFKEGKELAKEGAPGREFFVIIDGTAEVTRGKKKLRTLSDGDFFGEISLITKLPRTATVTTVSPTRALVRPQSKRGINAFTPTDQIVAGALMVEASAVLWPPSFAVRLMVGK